MGGVGAYGGIPKERRLHHVVVDSCSVFTLAQGEFCYQQRVEAVGGDRPLLNKRVRLSLGRRGGIIDRRIGLPHTGGQQRVGQCEGM